MNPTHMQPDASGKGIIRAVADLLSPHFQPPESWSVWLEVVLPILYGLPIDAQMLPIFQHATGRTQLFQGPITEAWFLCGRRSGKSRFLALMAVCLALFRRYDEFTAPGERPLVMVLAVDKDQAQIIFGYARALIEQTPMLAAMIDGEPRAEEIDLTNGVTIGVHTSSYKSVRGRTLAAALCDEIAFWRADDSRNPAESVLRALRPALSTIPNAPLICASSTYSQDGALYDAYTRHFGKDTSNVLIWKADTRTMNPSFRQSIIDEAYAADASGANAEYGAGFFTDMRAFLPGERIDDAIVPDRLGLTRDPHIIYVAFVDVSGGAHDNAGLGIAHLEAGRLVVLDRLETMLAPFKPEEMTQRFCDVLSAFGLNRVVGDAYGSLWVRESFQRYGVTYSVSELNASEIYLSAQPLFQQGCVELVDDKKLHGELRRLERRPRAGGKDLVTHPPGCHDDRAVAACGALVLAAKLSSAARTTAALLRPARHVNGLDYSPWDRDRENESDRYERVNVRH